MCRNATSGNCLPDNWAEERKGTATEGWTASEREAVSEWGIRIFSWFRNSIFWSLANLQPAQLLSDFRTQRTQKADRLH